MDIDERTRRLGRAVARERARVGLTQRQLAEMVGTGQSVIWHIEGGTANARVSTIFKIADALGVDAADLFAH